jgi:hypothetical protein
MLPDSKKFSRFEKSMAKLAWARRWGTGIGLVGVVGVEQVWLWSDACGRGEQ